MSGRNETLRVPVKVSGFPLTGHVATAKGQSEPCFRPVLLRKQERECISVEQTRACYRNLRQVVVKAGCRRAVRRREEFFKYMKEAAAKGADSSWLWGSGGESRKTPLLFFTPSSGQQDQSPDRQLRRGRRMWRVGDMMNLRFLGDV